MTPRRSRTTAAAMALVGCVAVLTGCAATSTAEPSRTRTPSATSSVSPSASPTPSASASTASVLLSTAGLGPIRMGRPVPATQTLLRWDPTACLVDGDPSVVEGQPYAGLWVPTAPRTGDSPLQRDSAFGVVTEDGTRDGAVSLLQVWASDYRTPSGLHVGSTAAEVRAALPGTRQQTDGNARWYSVVSAGWRITFTLVPPEEQTAAGDVVHLITVTADAGKDWSWWGTDMGAHCPV